LRRRERMEREMKMRDKWSKQAFRNGLASPRKEPLEGVLSPKRPSI